MDSARMLEGYGRVAGGLIPQGHPMGGPSGKRVVWGEGIWPAEMILVRDMIKLKHDFIRSIVMEPPVRFVVHSPAGPVSGRVSQPGVRGGLLRALTTDLGTKASAVRIEADGRLWWLRGVGPVGARIERATGERIFFTRRLHGVVTAHADDLDVSVALLAFTAIPSSAYHPVFGF
ncbi:hypothetical protein [Frankia sp. Cas4]|uniref:hypothetical protein n=1 Tax=Frankia sp. Cas4 TaxID=3073927 RepID=UPI002AD513D8|nr:hypothetical protein [Frankia sp. Cas4]